MNQDPAPEPRLTDIAAVTRRSCEEDLMTIGHARMKQVADACTAAWNSGSADALPA